MRTRFTIVSVLVCLAECGATAAAELIKVPADSQKGFEFPYLLFVPKMVEGGPPQYLLIEPNNTGTASDNPDDHLKAAIQTAKENGVGNDVARRLGIPLLVPIFPRPMHFENREFFNTYTQMLNRKTILIENGPFRRIDLQLLAMAQDAQIQLKAIHRPVSSKILITGFSSSGQFANRFTFLHPEVVAAAAYGGLNGFIMVPIEEIDSKRLEFPLGLADYKKITGCPFDRATYSRIPQFAYMGAKDYNDAVLYEDAYSEGERCLVFKLFGRRMMPERWNAVKKVYREQNLPNVKFKEYPGIGHCTDEEVHRDIADFFRSAIEQPPKT